MDNWRPDSFIARRDHQFRIGQQRAESVIADIGSGRMPSSLSIAAFFGHRRNRPLPTEANPVHQGYNSVVRDYLSRHNLPIPAWVTE
jgi:hypothetical protein